jgi:hypothetical protein
MRAYFYERILAISPTATSGFLLWPSSSRSHLSDRPILEKRQLVSAVHQRPLAQVSCANWKRPSRKLLPSAKPQHRSLETANGIEILLPNTGISGASFFLLSSWADSLA